MLTETQKAFYRDNGYLVLENQIPAAVMDEANDTIAAYLEGARGLETHNEIFDLEDSHRPDAPRVRRVKLPHARMEVIDRLMRSAHILAPVQDLIGPAIRLQTSKLNLKAAGYGAAIEWHQDWAFYPHTNDDILAVGVMLDDVGPDNGPLMVFPGSHRGPVHDHHSNGVFAGAMDLAAAGLDPADAVTLTAPRGSISIHHVRIVHGSDLNRSPRDRAMLFYEIAASDAWPLQGAFTPMNTLAEFDSRILAGPPTIEPRLAPVPVRIPLPRPADPSSIYQVQKAAGRRAFAVHEEAGTAAN